MMIDLTQEDIDRIADWYFAAEGESMTEASSCFIDKVEGIRNINGTLKKLGISISPALLQYLPESERG